MKLIQLFLLFLFGSLFLLSCSKKSITDNGALEKTIIIGKVVKCNNESVTHGSFEIEIRNQIFSGSINNGSFTFNDSLFNNSQTANVTVIDSSTNQQASYPITINPGTNNIGVLMACGTSSLQFINFNFNGSDYLLKPPSDSINLIKSGPPISQFYTAITGTRWKAGTIEKLVYFYLQFNDVLPGSFYASLSVEVPGIFATGGRGFNMPLVVTEYGNNRGYVAGTFTGTVYDDYIVYDKSWPINGSFRLRSRR